MNLKFQACFSSAGIIGPNLVWSASLAMNDGLLCLNNVIFIDTRILKLTVKLKDCIQSDQSVTSEDSNVSPGSKGRGEGYQFQRHDGDQIYEECCLQVVPSDFRRIRDDNPSLVICRIEFQCDVDDIYRVHNIHEYPKIQNSAVKGPHKCVQEYGDHDWQDHKNLPYSQNLWMRLQMTVEPAWFAIMGPFDFFARIQHIHRSGCWTITHHLMQMWDLAIF